MDNYLSDSLNHYYDTLKVTGYIKQNTVNKLLVLVFIQELLKGKYKKVLTEGDYRIIGKSLSQIFGTACQLSFPQ